MQAISDLLSGNQITGHMVKLRTPMSSLGEVHRDGFGAIHGSGLLLAGLGKREAHHPVSVILSSWTPNRAHSLPVPPVAWLPVFSPLWFANESWPQMWSEQNRSKPFLLIRDDIPWLRSETAIAFKQSCPMGDWLPQSWRFQGHGWQATEWLWWPAGWLFSAYRMAFY